MGETPAGSSRNDARRDPRGVSMLKRILTVVGWTVGNPAAVALLTPREDDYLTTFLVAAASVLVVVTAVSMARRPRHAKR